MHRLMGGSWGRPAGDSQKVIYLPSRFDAQSWLLAQTKPMLPYGQGRSYGDVCTNESGVLISTEWLDRFIAFDQNSGQLQCEAGVCLGDIQRFAISRGWSLPVTPGTQAVTVAGAIANDVHGKNHHRQGTFGRHVLEFELIRSDGSKFTCRQTVNAGLFQATIGGLGLTGLITQVTLQLIPCPSDYLMVESEPFDGLEQFFQLADASESAWENTVAWLDCVTSHAGRGIFIRANPCDEFVGNSQQKVLNFPYPFQGNMIKQPVNRLMAWAYYHANKHHKQKKVHYQSFFYPLDVIKHWSKFYGKKGLYQFQCVIPHQHRLEGSTAILDSVRQSGLASFLTVLKTFSNKVSPGLMSFPMPGVTLALDFVAGERQRVLLNQLESLVLSFGGRLYPAKDAVMRPETFQQSFPQLNEWLSYRDPGFSSDFVKRLIK